jgi:hypothetical protein
VGLVAALASGIWVGRGLLDMRDHVLFDR